MSTDPCQKPTDSGAADSERAGDSNAARVPQRIGDPISLKGARLTVVTIAGILLLLGIFFGPILWSEHQNQRILREGAPAMARVKDIRPTGNSLNDQPEVRLVLDVQPNGGEPFETDFTTYMNQVYLPRYQPGAVTEVRIDPRDSRRVALVGP